MPISFTCPHCGTQTNVADQYAGQSGPCARCGKIISVPAPGGAPVAVKPQTNTVLIVCLVTLGLCVLGVPVLGVLMGLLLPAVAAVRESARTTACSNNLMQISRAMQAYESQWRCYPPAYLADKNGKPVHSWRVLLLPYLDEQALYQQYRFDEPWNGPNNRGLAERIPKIFRCPSEAGPNSQTTPYLVVVGPRTVFPGAKSTRTADLLAGLASVVLVVETTGMDVNWMEPRDLDEKALEKGIVGRGEKGIGSWHASCANAVMADGSTRRLDRDMDRELLRAIFFRDGQRSDRTRLELK